MSKPKAGQPVDMAKALVDPASVFATLSGLGVRGSRI